MSIEINKSINFVVHGEPASKANSRKIVNFGKDLELLNLIKLEIMKKYLHNNVHN